MRIRFYVSVTVLSVLGALLYLLWPVYGFMAEDNPDMRAPWGWHKVPDADSCQAGIVLVTPDLDISACRLLLDYQSTLHTPSLSVAVARRGDVVWSSAVGWADIENAVLAMPQHLYRIGSTSKPVTGTLLARMVQEGVVSLDEPIGRYVSDLPNADWQQLSLRQLASHMAGLPEYETNRDLLGLYHSMALRRPHTDVRQGLYLFDGSPQRFAPGSDFEYSSFGSLLIASVLQEVAGKPFRELMNLWVLSPLSLHSPVPDQFTADRVNFYQLDGDSVQPWREVDLSNKLPGGGFMSTPEDLTRLGAAWLDPAFISTQIRDLFWQPQVLSTGEVNEQSYALTWRWNETLRYAHHGGVSKGAMAWLAVYPDQELVIAMTINTTLPRFADFSSLQTELFNLFSEVSTAYQYEESRLPDTPH